MRLQQDDGQGGGRGRESSAVPPGWTAELQPEDTNIKKGPTVTGRLPKQIYGWSMALKHLLHLL